MVRAIKGGIKKVFYHWNVRLLDHYKHWVWNSLPYTLNNNSMTYLNVYCLKHRILLTFDRTLHALFIVNLSSYICLRTMESTYPDLKAVASFCWKGAD